MFLKHLSYEDDLASLWYSLQLGKKAGLALIKNKTLHLLAWTGWISTEKVRMMAVWVFFSQDIGKHARWAGLFGLFLKNF